MLLAEVMVICWHTKLAIPSGGHPTDCSVVFYGCWKAHTHSGSVVHYSRIGPSVSLKQMGLNLSQLTCVIDFKCLVMTNFLKIKTNECSVSWKKNSAHLSAWDAPWALFTYACVAWIYYLNYSGAEGKATVVKWTVELLCTRLQHAGFKPPPHTHTHSAMTLNGCLWSSLALQPPSQDGGCENTIIPMYVIQSSVDDEPDIHVYLLQKPNLVKIPF